MGPDLDSNELTDAVGKRRTAKTCSYTSSNEDTEATEKRSPGPGKPKPRGRRNGSEPSLGPDDLGEPWNRP